MDLTPETINAVLAAIRPHFNPEGTVHLDLAVTRMSLKSATDELASRPAYQPAGSDNREVRSSS